MKPRLTAVLMSLALVCAPTLFVAPQLAHAQDSNTKASFTSTVTEPVPVNVLVGQSKVITFDSPIERFSVSNPEVAEAVLITANQVVVNGKAFGQINFIAWEKGTGRFMVFDVFVRTNLSLIDSQIRALFPKDDIRLSQANGSVVLSGTVKNLGAATQAEAVVQAAGFKTVNMLQSPVADLSQVQLQVRVAEVSRNRLRDLGASYAYQASPGSGGFVNGGGPGSVTDVTGGILGGTFSSLNLLLLAGNTTSMIRALQTQGAIRALAEPNLIAMNGQQASFLAGGEYPVPVVQAGSERSTVTIIFKEYGVRLNFKPTIIDEDHIRLELEPEVSTLDFANGVKFEGFLIPALRTRRAKTGVELRDGQSFALAGLLDNNETQSLSKVPGLGDIPVLGPLFRSKSFQKQESELMFIVTAQMVKPVNRDDLPQLHGVDNLKKGSPLGIEPTKSGGSTGGSKGEGIDGSSGYSIGTATSPNPSKSDDGLQQQQQPPAHATEPKTMPVTEQQQSISGKTVAAANGAPLPTPAPAAQNTSAVPQR